MMLTPVIILGVIVGAPAIVCLVVCTIELWGALRISARLSLRRLGSVRVRRDGNGKHFIDVRVEDDWDGSLTWERFYEGTLDTEDRAVTFATQLRAAQEKGTQMRNARKIADVTKEFPI